MIKGPLRFLALLALALSAAFAVPALASAHTVKTIVPGAFCSHEGDVGVSKKGKTYVCTFKGGHLRWEPSDNPLPTPTEGSTAIPTTAPTTAPPVDVTTVPGSPTPSTSAAATLPTTGTRTDVMAIGGLVLLGGGTAGVLWGRRRKDRVTFEA